MKYGVLVERLVTHETLVEIDAASEAEAELEAKRQASPNGPFWVQVFEETKATAVEVRP